MIKLVICIFFLASLFSFLKYKTNKITKSFFLLVLLLILLAAFRDGNAVRDYNEYVRLYKSTTIIITEASFFIISWLVKYVFSDNIIFLFIIYAIIGVGLKTKAIRELTTLCFLSLVIYISNFYILHELTQIRVGVAAGFLLLCIKPIYERNLRKFIIFASCAVFFHYSALPIFFLWFFKGKKINKYIYALIIPVSYIFYFLNINLIELIIQFIPIKYIQEKYVIYKLVQTQNPEQLGKINVFNYVFLARCLIFYIVLWKSKVVIEHNKYSVLVLKIMALSLSSFVFFSAIPIFAFRISELLGVVEIILIPFLYYIFRPKILAASAVVFVGLCVLLITLFYENLIFLNS